MIAADAFIAAAAARGRSFYASVPCSFLTPLLNGVIARPDAGHVGASSEGEALAIAAGAWLAGREAVMMCQNSGLGNAVNPLTSLTWSFRIPIMMIVTWRGEPGLGDEPQHELMGQITAPMLDLMRVPHAPFPADTDAIAAALDTAGASMRENRLPYAFILRKGQIRAAELDEPAPVRHPAADILGAFTRGDGPRRIEMLERLCALAPDDAGLIATTGFCGRELFTHGDLARNFYVVGSMGCASALGLGAALNSARPIIVLDGDGAALMKLGNMATIGQHAPRNLTHILLDNCQHESTGGQRTVSAGVDFATIARATGYRFVARADTLAQAEALFKAALKAEGPRFVHLRVSPSRLQSLARPDITPPEVARRFRRFLGGAA